MKPFIINWLYLLAALVYIENYFALKQPHPRGHLAALVYIENCIALKQPHPRDDTVIGSSPNKHLKIGYGF